MGHLRDVIDVIARALADDPGAVKVTETEHRGTALVEVFAAPGDVGKLIGRQGRTVAALRTIASATAQRDGRKATLEIRDSVSRP